MTITDEPATAESTKPTAAEKADVCDKAADVIEANGFYRHYLYNATQARGGTALEFCAVDLYGAINIAAGGTPRYTGRDTLAWETEKAVLARSGEFSLVNWCTRPGNDQVAAARLLRDTADQLRDGVAK